MAEALWNDMTSSFAPLIVKKIDIQIAVRYIALKKKMDNGCTYKKVYVPMTETGFYILLCLRSPNHGYGIVQKSQTMKAYSVREPCMEVYRKWKKTD